MAGKKPRLSALAARKQLLIAESELNRTILAGDCARLAAGVQGYIQHAKRFGSFLSVFKLFSAGFLAFKAAVPARETRKRSWVSTLASGAMRVSSLWNAFQSRNGK